MEAVDSTGMEESGEVKTKNGHNMAGERLLSDCCTRVAFLPEFVLYSGIVVFAATLSADL